MVFKVFWESYGVFKSVLRRSEILSTRRSRKIWRPSEMVSWTLSSSELSINVLWYFWTFWC